MSPRRHGERGETKQTTPREVIGSTSPSFGASALVADAPLKVDFTASPIKYLSGRCHTQGDRGGAGEGGNSVSSHLPFLI